MANILMCKNRQVYNIDTECVYYPELLPGYMQACPCSLTFKHWFALRYSSDTNAVAEHLRSVSFGRKNRSEIDTATHALSLSDAYWIAKSGNTTEFEQISPYYQPFWAGNGLYENCSIPTLYVNGFLTKEWVSATELRKYGEAAKIEKECADICKMADIPVVSISELADGSGIAVNLSTQILRIMGGASSQFR